MKITLIHNPAAGGADRLDAKVLKDLVRNAGHDLTYQSAEDADWRVSLTRPADLVVAAGGDGTVARVARELAGKGRAFAALPMGTANNISRSLGLLDLPIEDHVHGWRHARRVALDVGVAAGPWGEQYFVEGLGLGLLTRMIHKADASEVLARIDDVDQGLDYALKMLQHLLQDQQSRPIRATIDGQDISGNYLMFEVLNMPFVGPSLYLAPQADPGDGMLDVVTAGDDQRRELLRCVTQWREGRQATPVLPTLRGAHLCVEPTPEHIHIDDRIWRAGDTHRPNRPDIEVNIIRGALECLVPTA